MFRPFAAGFFVGLLVLAAVFYFLFVLDWGPSSGYRAGYGSDYYGGYGQPTQNRTWGPPAYAVSAASPTNEKATATSSLLHALRLLNGYGVLGSRPLKSVLQ